MTDKILVVKVNKYSINFTIVYNGEAYSIQTSRNQYYSLMILISNFLAIPNFGLCCGMGSCGTCMVQICEKNSSIKISTLSCALQVNDELANTIIFITDGIY